MLAGKSSRASVTLSTPGGPKPAPGPVSQLRQDLEGLNLAPSSPSSTAATQGSSGASSPRTTGADEEQDIGPPPPVAMAKEKILEEVRQKDKDSKPVLSLVVVGKRYLKNGM